LTAGNLLPGPAPALSVIPVGAGPCQAGTVCDRFESFPGSVPTNAGKGSESRLDRRSTRVAGLVLTPIPCGAESGRRERDYGVVGGRVSPMSLMDCGAEPRSGCRSSLRRERGQHGAIRPQPGGINQDRSTAPRVGVRQRATSRLAAPVLVLMLLGSGNGCDRRATRRRPA